VESGFKSTPEPITAIAQRLTTKDRRDEYGHPMDDFTRIATFWQPIVDAAPSNKITAEKVALMMAVLKVARLCHGITHRDSIVDLAGYANCLDLINQRRDELAKQEPDHK